VALDVTDPASIAGAVTACAGLPLAAVVNNAGYGQLAPLELLRPEELRAQFETNVIGLHAVTRAFLPLIRAGAGPGEGRIVQVASALGRISIPLLGAYNASKHAVVALAETLRLEIGREIPVILVEPGVIETGWRAVLVKTWGDLPRRAKGTSYEKVLQRYQEAGEGLAGEHGLSPAFCAEQIAAAMSRTRPPRRVVIGADSRWSQVAQSWTPAWIFEWALRRRYGIG
jgi:NAD(P)-dependent dehydrogenase (short-subunit alcohol dehydrogenase family)